MSFLKAEWKKLIMVNYTVNPSILKNYVPNGVELDLFENKCYISLVGFMFKNTTLLGIKVPYHVDFEEVNLRFYVKRNTEKEIKRGVVFIKEIVPKPGLTFVANSVYKENYHTLPMKHNWNEQNDFLNIEYLWKCNQKWNSISVKSDKKALPIVNNSETHFIAEHYWGYTKKNKNKTIEYEVTHPIWEYYPVIESSIDVDFKANYGKEFEFLNHQKPASIMLLEGSEITVENKVII